MLDLDRDVQVAISLGYRAAGERRGPDRKDDPETDAFFAEARRQLAEARKAGRWIVCRDGWYRVVTHKRGYDLTASKALPLGQALAVLSRYGRVRQIENALSGGPVAVAEKEEK